MQTRVTTFICIYKYKKICDQFQEVGIYKRGWKVGRPENDCDTEIEYTNKSSYTAQATMFTITQNIRRDWTKSCHLLLGTVSHPLCWIPGQPLTPHTHTY